MAKGKFVSYCRVSTRRQGDSGLGLEAQRKAVADYLNGGSWQLVAEEVEIESGKRNDRPKLAEALRLCRLHGATLIIARLDRLARNVAFVSNLMESGVEFVAVDFPQANRLTIHVLAAVAEHEAEAASTRTKAALARKRAFYAGLTEAERIDLRTKGKATQLGGDRGNLPTVARQGSALGVQAIKAKADATAEDLARPIRALQAQGLSLRQIAQELTQQGIETPRKGKAWSSTQVSRIIARKGLAG